MAAESGLPRRRMGPIWGLLLLFLVFFLLSEQFRFQAGGTVALPYSEFLREVERGNVSEVIISPESIDGRLKGPALQAEGDGAATGSVQPSSEARAFSTDRVPGYEDPELIRLLTERNVKLTGARGASAWAGLLVWVVMFGLLMGVWIFAMRRMMGSSPKGSGFMSLGRSKAKVYVEKGLKTRFSDVAGVDEVKDELTEVVSFLKEPVRYARLGGRMPKGVLLVGPPGTGKTLLARAVAGEAGVPFFSINGSEFVEMFVGLGAARVRDLFQQAREQAPCIVFIDELDALGKARGLSAMAGGANDEKEQTLNQLLAEMDGFDSSTGVIILAATNRPEVLDPALLRAGRFDRNVVVDRPDRKGREQILSIHVRKVKLAPEVDIPSIAGMTAGFSGAELANLANEAALIATRRGAESVELRDFTEAVERIVAGLERRNRILGPREKRRVAYHEMGHAVVALALGKEEVIHKISIIPRGVAALGFTMSRPTEDRYLMEKKELESRLAILLGGRASEMAFFEDISTGAGDDLDKASEIARAMVTRYGMSAELGLGVYEREPAALLGGQAPIRTYAYSDDTARRIDDETQKLLQGALIQATQVIHSRRAFIEEAAQKLLQIETIDEAGLKELWQKHERRPELESVA